MSTHTLSALVREQLPATKEEIAEKLNLPKEQVRSILSALQQAGLVDVKRVDGTKIFVWELT